MTRPASGIFDLGESQVEWRMLLPFGPQIDQGVPAASCTRHVLENAAGPTRPQEVLGFEELLINSLRTSFVIQLREI